jgi:hypothetical protein
VCINVDLKSEGKNKVFYFNNELKNAKILQFYQQSFPGSMIKNFDEREENYTQIISQTGILNK